jgi:hypothetical protein
MQTYKRLSTNTNGLFTSLIEGSERPKYKTFYATNCYGVVQVLDRENLNDTKIRFLDTGYERSVSIHNLTKGKARDITRKKPVVLSTDYEDITYTNKDNCTFRILWRKGESCGVKFDATGYERVCFIANATKGKVRDPYNPVVYGIGFLGEFDYDASTTHKYEYSLWHNMLKRAYCESDKRGYYGKGVEVEKRWHCFKNFMGDVTKLRNYDQWKVGVTKQSTDKFNLDKDFAYDGCNVYSKDTCEFIPESLNKGTTRNTLDRLDRIAKYKGNR